MRLFIAAITLIFSASSQLYADVLASYNFTGSVRTSSDVDSSSTATALADGAGWTSTIDTTNGNTAPSVSVLSTLTGATEALAISGNDYYEFTITPTLGFQLNLTSLTFDYRRLGGGLISTFFVRSSADNYATTLGTATSAADTFANASISLTGGSFQNLTSPLTFRVYVFDNQDNAGKNDLVDNIVLNGTTAAVPEPSTGAMIAIGIALLVGAQRYRRNRI